MIYGNKFLPKNIVENSIFTIESVACEEYFNRIDLLESCTDESSRPILEAQVQVLYEISFKDIIAKIKEIWEKFKAWVKDLWNRIFDKEKRQKEREEKVHKAAEKFVNSIFEETDKKAYEKTAILRNIYFPFWSEDEESAGDNRIFSMAKYPGDLSDIVKRYVKYIDEDCDKMGKMVTIEYSLRGEDAAVESLQKYIDRIKKNISNIVKYKIFFKPIIELEGSQVFTMLNNYRLDVEDDSKENLLKVDKIFVDTIYGGFEDDRKYIQTIKKDIDGHIKEVDKCIYTDITSKIDKLNKENEDRQKNNESRKSEGDKRINSKWVKYEEIEVDNSDNPYSSSKTRIIKVPTTPPVYSDEDTCPEGFMKNRYYGMKSFGNDYYIKRNDEIIAENKETIEKIQNAAKAIRACITAFQSETNCIANLEVQITKSIDRAISEHEKLVKNLREKYHTDTDGSDTSMEV